MKEVIIVGGPNGSGKTTFALEFLSEFDHPFLNADIVQLSIKANTEQQIHIAAARIILKTLHQKTESEESFIIESTMSGKFLINAIKMMKKSGYTVSIFFVYLENVEDNLNRIRSRVSKGGHDVAEEDVRRRFERSKRNFWNFYRHQVDKWTLINNTDKNVCVVASGNLIETIILDQELLNTFTESIVPA